jgi:hypothetical protein
MKNYILEIKAFNDYLLQNCLSTGEIALWYALMNINNKTAWSEDFTSSNLVLQQLTGMSRQGLDGARKNLINKGLITYVKGTQDKAGTYHIYSLLERYTNVSLDTVVDTTVDTNNTPQFTPQQSSTIQDSSTLNKLNKTKPNQTKQVYDQELFNRFWKEYPRKEAKATAISAWNKLNVDDIMANTIIEGVKYYKQSKQWQDKQYIPHPSTFLNQRRWEVEEEKSFVQKILEGEI